MSDALRPLTDPILTLDLRDEAETRQLAEDIAAVLSAGDLVCLSGDLGAGKSTFARALIRAFADQPELEVPSPTFTLVQTYNFDRFDISHFDLYRLEEPEEIAELGLEELLETGAALVEWPELGGDLMPDGGLWIRFSETDENGMARRATFSSEVLSWQERVRLTLDVRTFLKSAGRKDASRRFLAGDASLRSFESVRDCSGAAVLMKWPFQKALAIPAQVSAYMAKVNLARDCRSVVAIGGELRRRGFAAPSIHAADLQRGLLLMDDLGRETIAPEGKAEPDRYRVAVDVLALLHEQNFPELVPLQDGATYAVPDYTTAALLAEAELFLDWFIPEKTGSAATGSEREAFRLLWTGALQFAANAERGWVLRDFHSPNLLWRDGRSGTDRIGLIDFQDTVIGPLAYDLGSLLFDARTDISDALEKELLEAYLTARRKKSSGFDENAFLSAYAVMSAQRITKILGIFVRLARRDGKMGYLSYIPRMIGYLQRATKHSSLTDLGTFFARYMD